MDYLNSILLQLNRIELVDEAIPTLSDRLQNATLSSDRRSAVLGLKSFSRGYRELVVEYGLKALIMTLKKDRDNSLTVKVVLETLLILFIRGEGEDDPTRGWISQQSRLQNGKYPSPLLIENKRIDQISLLISDELTQDPDVIATLIELLQEYEDFHIKLYTIQLLECLISTRPDRTKQNMLNNPTAISTLVTLLHEVNEPLRNESILLLMGAVHKNFNIQKLVAFENTFDILFDIIHEEGGIRGSILVQDCLTLTYNLLSYNASNQKLFLETRGINHLAKLISEPLDEQSENNERNGSLMDVLFAWTDQRIQNIRTCFDICDLFVSEGLDTIRQNQQKLFDSGILFITLKLAFSPITVNDIRAAALITTANILQGNSNIQYLLSQIDVPYIDPTLPKQLNSSDYTIPVPLALLNWALFMNSVHVFDIRLASAFCLRAYFKDNLEASSAFLSDQIKVYSKASTLKIEHSSDMSQVEEDTESKDQGTPLKYSTDISGLSSHEAQIGNIFSTLMEYDADIKLNPYKIWFSAIILIFIFDENDMYKETARCVTTGDSLAGEEVMTSIEAISGLLVASLSNNDARVAIGYLMLLSIWLYEDPLSVNEFLKDPLVVRSLMNFLSDNSSEKRELVHSMAALLLGIAYEFCSKNSPIPRNQLHELLKNGLGKDNYSLQVRKLRDNKLFNDFTEESMMTSKKDETGLPEVFFVINYVELVKDNFRRIKNALMHDPNVEPKIHLSYENFESLENEVAELRTKLDRSLRESNEEKIHLSAQIEEMGNTRDNLQSSLNQAENELGQIKDEYNSLKVEHENVSLELKRVAELKEEFEDSSEKSSTALLDSLKQLTDLKQTLATLQSKLDVSEQAKSKAEEGINKMGRELLHLTKDKLQLEASLNTLEKKFNSYRGDQEKTLKKLEDKFDLLQQEKIKVENMLRGLKEEIVVAKRVQSQTELDRKELQTKLIEAKASNDHLIKMLRESGVVMNDLKAANKETEAQCEKLREDLEQKKSRISILEKDLAALQERSASLNTELAALKSSTTKDIGDLKLVVKDLTLEKEVLIEENDGIREKIDILREELERRKEELDGANSQMKQIQDTKSDLSRHRDELEKRLEVVSQEKESLEENYRQQIIGLEGDNKTFEEQINELNSSLSNLRRAKNDISNEFESYKRHHDEQVSVLTKQKDKLNKALMESTDKIAEMLTTISKSEDTIRNLKENINSLSIHNTELDKKNDKLRASSTANEEESKVIINDLNLKVESLQISKEKETKQRTEIEKKLEDVTSRAANEKIKFEKDIEQLKRQLGDTNSDLKKSNSLVSQKEKAFKELENSILSNNESDVLKKEIENYRTRLLEVQESNSRIQDDLQNSQAKCSDLLGKLDTREMSLKNAEKEKLNAEAEYSEQIKALKEQSEQLVKEKSSSSKEIDQLKTDKKSTFDKLRQQEEDLQHIKNTLIERDEKIKQLSGIYEEKEKTSLECESIKKDRIDLENKLSLASKEIGSLEDRIKALTLQLQENDNKQELLLTTKAELRELREVLERTEQTRAELQKRLDMVSIEREKTVASLSTEIKSLAQKIEEHDKEATDFEKEIENLSSQNENLKLQKSDLVETNKELEVQSERLRSKLEILKADQSEFEDLKKRNKQLSSQVKDLEGLKKKCDDLEKELSQSRESEQKLKVALETLSSPQSDTSSLESGDMIPKSELDDIMLLVSELDENVKKYKKKLRLLGGEVSSDEDQSSDQDSTSGSDED